MKLRGSLDATQPLLDYFIGTVKNCLEQQHKDRTLQ